MKIEERLKLKDMNKREKVVFDFKLIPMTTNVIVLDLSFLGNKKLRLMQITLLANTYSINHNTGNTFDWFAPLIYAVYYF